MGILMFLPIVAFEILRYPEFPPFDESLVNDNLKHRPPYVDALTFEYQLKNYYPIMQHLKAFGNTAFLGGLSGVFSACIYSTESHKKFVHSFNNDHLNSFDNHSIFLFGSIFGAVASFIKPLHPTYKISQFMNFVESPIFGAIVGVLSGMAATYSLSDDEIHTLKEVFGVDEVITNQDL
jgi:hypothetical protein